MEEFVDGIPQSWWSEDTRDKEVLLLINVQGSRTLVTGTHRIHVRHCFTSNTVRLDSKSNYARKHSGSTHSRSVQKHAGATSDTIDDHRSLRGP